MPMAVPVVDDGFGKEEDNTSSAWSLYSIARRSGVRRYSISDLQHSMGLGPASSCSWESPELSEIDYIIVNFVVVAVERALVLLFVSCSHLFFPV